MGPIQTFYYLALVGAVFIALALLLVGIALSQLRTWSRLGQDRLLRWIVGGAILLMFLFISLTTVGVLVVVLHGSSQS